MQLTQEQINDIKVGEVYSSWKQICEKLQIPYKPSSKSQSYQRLEFSRYFDFEKVGRKYHILAKFEVPLVKPYTGKSPYRELLQFLILDYVANHHNTIHGDGISLPQDGIFLALAMVNNNFHLYRTQSMKQRLSDELDINTRTIDIFYNRHSSRFASIVTGALNSLHNQAVISWKLNKYLVKQDYSRELINDVIENRIIDIESDILKLMQYKDKSEVFLAGVYESFMDKIVNEYNALYNDDVKYIYKSYDILYNSDLDYIQKKKRMVVDKLQDRIGTQIELNTKIVEGIVNNASKRIENNLYLQNELMLTDKLIKR